MRLTSFSVEKFRSITNARTVDLDNYTVLIGPNNEGKSNILRALSIGFSTIDACKQMTISPISKVAFPQSQLLSRLATKFNAQRDFPMGQKINEKDNSTTIILNFLLNTAETEELQKKTNCPTQSEIIIKTTLNDLSASLTVSDSKGPTSELSRCVSIICDFICEKFRFEYIPAVRTAGQIKELVGGLIEREMKRVEKDPRYQEALDLVKAIEEPEYEKLGQGIAATIKKFLPNVQAVRIAAKREFSLSRYGQNLTVNIDDGTLTSIDQKGEGVQSLVALALMRHLSERNSGSESVLLAIEEPESHLHPSAIRELRSVILDISQNNQVIVSTHSPIFVYPTRIGNNILVLNNEASPAKSVEVIRDALGVGLSDSLHLAELVLLVEGLNDTVSLTAVLQANSEFLSDAISQRRLAIVETGSSSKLAFNANFYLSNACAIHAFFDNDVAGRSEINKAIKKSQLSPKDYHLATVIGKTDSEFEDLINEEIYADALKQKYGVDISKVNPEKRNLKWTDRMKSSFQVHSKIWDDNTEKELKLLVSGAVKMNAASAITAGRSRPIDSLIEELINKLRKN